MIKRFLVPVLALSFMFSVNHANAASSADALISTFEAVCMESGGSQEFIKKWVNAEHFGEVTGTEDRKLYAGTVNAGYAWFKQTDTAILVVAIRPATNACAVFSSRAPQSEVMEYIEALPQKLVKKWPVSTKIKDDALEGEFGVRRGRVITLGTSTQPVSVMIAAITNERAGGPYQATIQAGFSYDLSAETGNVDTNIREAVDTFQELYDQSGISGVAEYLKGCYAQFDTIKNEQQLQRCAAIDCCGMFMDTIFSRWAEKRTGKPLQYPYFKQQAFLDRVEPRFRSIGLSDADRKALIDKTWKTALSYLKQKNESGKIPVTPKKGNSEVTPDKGQNETLPESKKEVKSPEVQEEKKPREINLADGSKYVGDILDGKMHGQGTYIWASGDKYVGEFQNNRATGGWLYRVDGSKSWMSQDPEGKWVTKEQ